MAMASIVLQMLLRLFFNPPSSLDLLHSSVHALNFLIAVDIATELTAVCYKRTALIYDDEHGHSVTPPRGAINKLLNLRITIKHQAHALQA